MNTDISALGARVSLPALTRVAQGVRTLPVARPLSELLSDVEGALGAGARRASYNSNLVTAVQLAATLPLVHRTADPAQPLTWQEILRTGELRVSTGITEEERRCRWSRAVYFFLGSAAYHKGNVAFVFDRAVSGTVSGNFSPFDSGGLSGGLLEPINAGSWDVNDRARCLDRHSTDVADVEAFAGPYIAAHFNQPASYVSRPQRSDTDFAVYHELRSTNGDRRAWTIEVRLHGDVTLDLPRGSLLHIVLANRALEADVPDNLLEHVMFADAEPEGEGDVARTTAEIVLGRR